jgi:hypothetical protein
MGSKKALSCAVCLGTALSAAVWAGCRHTESTGNPSARVIYSSQTNAAGEYHTVDVAEPANPELSRAQLQLQAQEFRRQGWLILGISEPSPQPDGTASRRYLLKRATR